MFVRTAFEKSKSPLITAYSLSLSLNHPPIHFCITNPRATSLSFFFLDEKVIARLTNEEKPKSSLRRTEPQHRRAVNAGPVLLLSRLSLLRGLYRPQPQDQQELSSNGRQSRRRTLCCLLHSPRNQQLEGFCQL